jgi:8-oxo-dGTP pyrophosphatase MutT (NUDIX family)
LIPFLQSQGEWHLLYIRRTSKLNDPHSGQVAFPGGALDPEDTSLQATALREMHEEIGIAPDDVHPWSHDF